MTTTHQNAVTALFVKSFGSQPEHTVHAPGRVNLIGDHTDYNQGFVLPAAIDMGTDVAVSPRQDQQIKVVAAGFGEQIVSFDLSAIVNDEPGCWSNYVKGSILSLQTNHPRLSGADIAISGNLPQGAGLSSSASLEMALLYALKKLNQLPLDGVEAALTGQHAENNFVGCNCGIMDQLVTAMGKQGHAMLLDCDDLSFNDVSVPDDLSIVIINSNVKRGLVDSEYNMRRKQCEKVAKYFERASLRQVTLEELEQASDYLDDISYRRARHVITENDRTVQAAKALDNNDLGSLVDLMAGSQISLRDDFEVTTREIDGLFDIITEYLAGRGGIRMTGGGFGGCLVALMPAALISNLKTVLADEYPKQYGLTADVYICKTAQGAFR